MSRYASSRQGPSKYRLVCDVDGLPIHLPKGIKFDTIAEAAAYLRYDSAQWPCDGKHHIVRSTELTRDHLWRAP